ncbi:hypothetical protein [Microbacterium aerolatum]|uniref:hypothetical protein n=1 Tax=Microbacterium aerolatum TaxID=153731 RepID=UPI00384F2432
MSNPELVFKTTSPDAIAWHENLVCLRKEEFELRKAFEDEIVALFGPSQRDTYERDEHGNRKAQTGRPLWVRGDIAFALDSAYDEQPPVDSGWRLDSKDRNWQPKLASKAGKEWKRRLGELNLVHMRTRWREIGIPEVVFAGMRMYSPGLSYDDQTKTLYVLWGTQYVEDEWAASTSKLPNIEWTKVPLSEWHALRESKESS